MANTPPPKMPNSMGRIKLRELTAVRTAVLGLTHRQRQVLALCCDFYVANDQLPTTTVLAKRLQVASSNYPAEVLAVLEKRGLLERNEVKKYRFARVQGMSVGDYYRRGMPELGGQLAAVQ